MLSRLLPRPRSATSHAGSVTWTSPLRVKVVSEWRDVVATFADDLSECVGWEVTVSDDEIDGGIVVRHDASLGAEEYRLVVDDVTSIEAGSPAGVSYAFTALRQMGPDALWSSTRTSLPWWEVPRVTIDDGPAYDWRGVHLDVARHFFDVATVCRLIDLLAAHRLNKLHLHLNDDQGWRVEIPEWPALSEVGAWRRSSPVGHEDEAVDDDVAHGGFYTADDLRQIREHAERRFVRVVPEIDLPGHAQAVIAAYPELGNGSTPLEVWTRWGISEHVLNVSNEALTFAHDVVRYVASLFPASPVHIGGDECPTDEWERSELAQRVMDEHGFHDSRQLQGLFTRRLATALRDDGHVVLAWDEVLDADVDPETVICAWRSSAKAVEAAERGLDVVMAPMQFLYFDWLNSIDPAEPIAQAPVPYATTWQKVYDFSVRPPGLRDDLRHHILGAQAQLWTEYIATRDHLDYMAFPRVTVFSEVVWGTRTTVDELRPRLETQLGRLHLMGVRFRPLDPVT